MNKYFKVGLILFSLCILSVSAEVPDQEKIKKEIYSRFQQLFELKNGQGDETAKRLMEQAKKSAGNLNIEFAEMKKVMLEWDAGSELLFKKLQTQEEKINQIKEDFETLLKKKVSEKDPQAITIAEKGEANGGKLELTVRQMLELISKWEK